MGYLVEDLSYNEFIQVEKIDMDFDKHTKDATDVTIFVVDIFLTKLKLDYDRSYLKVQDVAATVGGFFSITYNVLKFIYYFYVENSLLYYYFQHLFAFYTLDGDSFIADDNQNKNNEQELESINIIPFNSVNNISHKNNESELLSNSPMKNNNPSVVNIASLNDYNKNGTIRQSGGYGVQHHSGDIHKLYIMIL